MNIRSELASSCPCRAPPGGWHEADTIREPLGRGRDGHHLPGSFESGLGDIRAMDVRRFLRQLSEACRSRPRSASAPRCGSWRLRRCSSSGGSRRSRG